ncbi:hypothetical protein, partial [Gordonia sp. (in: high G+C Gram-positive bacteria)]|uniref:hypothetical protein n=1 Tax=Gordonia sp. (in: high G+C Gram-positive bacteria) TaxID=84139 RepID=UPI002C5159C2
MAPRKLRPGLRLDELTRIDDPDDPDAPETYWGRAWMHVKKHDSDNPYLIANELICCRLAAAVGPPVLPGAVARAQAGCENSMNQVVYSYERLVHKMSQRFFLPGADRQDVV